MLSICKYKDIFGKPNEGVHSVRFFGIAIIDFILTLLVGLGIKYIFPDYNIILIYVILFTFGIIMHRMFCVNTTINKILFDEI